MEHEFERQLRALAIERRPEACLGCGFEHGCSVHGCAVIHAAVNRLAAYEETRLEPEDMKKAFNEDATLKLAGQILGVTPGRLRELAQAEKDGQLVFITKKMALAMIAGARAIEKNKRLQGVIYNYDIFGELGAPKEISYFEAAKVLREAAEAALDAMRGENNA